MSKDFPGEHCSEHYAASSATISFSVNENMTHQTSSMLDG